MYPPFPTYVSPCIVAIPLDVRFTIATSPHRFRTPQESTSLRFTTTDSAFYITTLVSPSPSFKVVSPVPVLPTDTITLLGGSGTALNFTIGGPEVGGEEEGVLTVHVSAEEAGMVKYAWAFEVKY